MKNKPKEFELLKSSDMRESLIKNNSNKSIGGINYEKEDIY